MYPNENPEDPTLDLREKLKNTVQILLGAPSVEVELYDEQYELAIDMALDNYRAWSANSKEECFLYLRLEEAETVYILPKEVEVVRKIYRRGNGVVSGSGSTVDPFSLAYSNTYMLSAVRGATGGGLLTYWAYHSFDETVAKLFGREIMFTYNPTNNRLVLERDIRGQEEVLIHVYTNRPEHMLYQHQSIYPWIRDWALAEAMLMLARARGKYGTLPSAQGGFTMDASAMKQEALDMKQQLRERLRRYEDGSTPMGFIIG